MRIIWQKSLIHSSACVQEPVTRMGRMASITTHSTHLGCAVGWVLLVTVLVLTQIMTSYVVVRITELEQTYGSLLWRPS
jgi:hypothetical protein